MVTECWPSTIVHRKSMWNIYIKSCTCSLKDKNISKTEVIWANTTIRKAFEHILYLIGNKTGFPSQNYPKRLYPSYKTDLDFGDGFGRKAYLTITHNCFRRKAYLTITHNWLRYLGSFYKKTPYNKLNVLPITAIFLFRECCFIL